MSDGPIQFKSSSHNPLHDAQRLGRQAEEEVVVQVGERVRGGDRVSVCVVLSGECSREEYGLVNAVERRKGACPSVCGLVGCTYCLNQP